MGGEMYFDNSVTRPDADVSSPHSRSVIGAQPAPNNDTQRVGMTTPIDDQWHEINSADGRCQRRRVMQVIFAASAAIAMLALFDAALFGAGETTVSSGSVRLVDQATDMPAPPADPNEVCRFNTVRVPCPPPPAAPLGSLLPPGAVWPPGAVELPGTGLPMPPLPPGIELPPEVSQMLQQGEEMLQSPPPNVPNEVCRFNTIRVPCP